MRIFWGIKGFFVVLIFFLTVGCSAVSAQNYTPGVDFRYQGCRPVVGCDEWGRVVADDTTTCGSGWKIVCGYGDDGTYDPVALTNCSCAKLETGEEVSPSNICSDCYIASDGAFVARNNNCGSGLTAQCSDGVGGPGLSQCFCLTDGTIEYYPGMGESSTVTSITHIYNPLCADGNSISTAFGCIPYDASEFAAKFLQILFGIAGGIAFLLMVYGFILVATSSGDEKKLQAAKETITSAITGLLISIFALFLFRLIVVNILKIPLD